MTSTTTITDQGPHPAWVDDLMYEIDTLEFAGVFDTLMDADTELVFGPTHVHGVEAIKEFFVKIDEPLITTHRIVETWTGDGVVLARGEATIAKRSEPEAVFPAPFVHIYYLDPGERPRIRTVRVTAGPLATDALL